MSWQQLYEIQRDAMDPTFTREGEPPLACPNDGQPLETGPDGSDFCPFDGWRPGPGDSL